MLHAPRRRILAALAFALAALSAAPAQAGSVIDRYTLRGTYVDGAEVSYTLYGKGAHAILGDLYSFDYYDALPLACDAGVCTPTGNPADEHGICYIGDIGKVCSLLSELSRNDTAAYTSGDHAWSRLVGCRVAGRGKPVVARLRLAHDYADHDIVVETVIDRCQPVE